MNNEKLKIIFDANEREITISGNAEGLRFLSGICLNVIGKEDPSGHFHLMEGMNNLEKGSVNTVIVYDPEL